MTGSTRDVFLRATLDLVSDGVIVSDTGGRILFLNSAAERLTGWPLQQCEGMPLENVFRIVNQQTRRTENNPVATAIRQGRFVQLPDQTILIARDGTERLIDDEVTPLLDDNGRAASFVLVFRDASARKSAEQELRESDERLQLTLTAGRMGNWDWRIQTNEVIWSPSLEELHGLRPGQFAGTFEAFQLDIHPDDRDHVLTSIQETLERRREHHLEYRIVLPDGGLRWLEGRGRLLFDESGAPVRMIGICVDITERKRTEATLRFLADASESLATLVDYRTTLQNVARLAVPSFADWCAVDMREADGALERLIIAHVDPNQVKMAEQLYRRYAADPDNPHGVTHILRTGKPILESVVTDEMLVEVSQTDEHLRALRHLGLTSYIGVPLTAHGRILGVITFITAESGREYLPRDLALAEDLAHRVTIAIENARLYHELREAGRRKDEFLAMLAHELRNPLTPIRSGLDILALRADGERETVKLMQQQVEHLVRLVDDLLDVSRVIRGGVELRTEPVEVSTIIQQSVDAIRSLIESREQELVIDMPAEAIWLNADPVRLVQVVENLLNNASKYTNQGGRVELAVATADGIVTIRVKDNGIGIEADLLPRVFDLFTQSSRSLDRAQGGIGIGLTLVRNLVELHGGKVTAHSAGSGKGSEFIVRIPLGDRVTQPAVERSESAVTSRRRILVVDDNADAVKMLAYLLTTLGSHEVETVFDGPAALAAVETFRPEVVLLDIGLPGMDGYEVARQIRRNPKFDRLLLVALTGYGHDDDRRKSHEAGFDEHLVKPPALEQINALLVHPKLTIRNADISVRDFSRPDPVSPK